jgi:competence ComEA-like helix-hairpin-helix protein
VERVSPVSLMPQPNHSIRPRNVMAVIAVLLSVLPAFTGLVFANKNPPTHPVDINLASAKELEELPGVGPTTAKAIIQFRTKTGRFHRVEDLLAIRGISETKLEKMRPFITVGVPPQKTPPPVKKPPPPPQTATPPNH